MKILDNKKRILVLLVCIFIMSFLVSCGKDKTPEDGIYTIGVSMTGGSGKASIDSPAKVVIKDGVITAEIVWSSPYYDYMIVGGEKYLPVNEEGNSTFEIEISALDQEIEVVADTTAMSKPHEIVYSLYFDSSTLKASDPVKVGSLDLLYADEFQVNYYEGGITKVIVNDTYEYVLDSTYNNIYVGGSATLDLFVGCEAIDNVAFTSTKAEDWTIPEIQNRVEDDSIKYVGKYSAPDFESLVADGCDLAIENTMIFHTPEIKEEIEQLGIPVIVDYSSYEKNPLGRMEWIKLYGILTGHLEEAEAFFNSKIKEVEAVCDINSYDGDIVKDENHVPLQIAYFYISSNGYAVVRCPGDYITRMIAMAGGEYALNDIEQDEDTNRSTMNMQMEDFVDKAIDADIIIYNSTIDGELESISDLVSKNQVFANFKAVKNGNVWCTNQDMYQHSTAIADMILDFNKLATKEADDIGELNYLYRLR